MSKAFKEGEEMPLFEFLCIVLAPPPQPFVPSDSIQNRPRTVR